MSGDQQRHAAAVGRARVPGQPVLPQVGDVITAPEDAYRFGVGRLRMRVDEVIGTAIHDTVLCVEVRGRDVRWNGTIVDGDRFAAVELARLTVERP